MSTLTAEAVEMRPCNGLTHIFFAKHAERPQARVRREQKAKKICESCSIRNLCREVARSNGEVYGVWGGETEAERWEAGFIQDLPSDMKRNLAIRIKPYGKV